MKEQGDRMVTNTDVEPPFGWINDFEPLDGFSWTENGAIAADIQMAGVNDNPKPLFGNLDNGLKVIFQAGNSYYVYLADARNVLRIVFSDLESIVEAINASGFEALPLVPPF
ncbi:hypothetical protein FBEOM_3975 [Fusarium beomiforme]|uniref:Uncharacterized protein n=1 Tax=Fusarium beomiforme TaxID=44412 RepID=A0A9P5E0X4_9HYPO|nr:hypothetical protein FBEOM_3975 [Fusarium beomiforme]